jgi:hypothetical protein
MVPPAPAEGVTVKDPGGGGGGGLLNVAVTVASPETVQVPNPLQPPPLQPPNVESLVVVALRVTGVEKGAVHVPGQLIPPGLLATVPVPLPDRATVREKETTGGGTAIAGLATISNKTADK